VQYLNFLKMKFINTRINSFGYAMEGIAHMLKMEANAKIHLLLSVTATGLGFALQISPIEWLMLVLIIALVWMAELFNTAIEKSMDIISVDYHPKIKIVKDLSAGAVLVCSIAAVITGCIIFIPKLLLNV
jgi:diacylglycerol kinase